MCQLIKKLIITLKAEVPLRIKIFGWYLRKGVILTKDNLAKQNWHGSKKYVFCHQDETIKHFLFSHPSSFDLVSAV
jgi:hypothetical protein